MASTMNPSIPIKKTGIKKTVASRITTGGKVATQGPLSPLYAQPAMKTAVDNVASSTTTLKARRDDYNNAKATFFEIGNKVAANPAGATSKQDLEWDRNAVARVREQLKSTPAVKSP